MGRAMVEGFAEAGWTMAGGARSEDGIVGLQEEFRSGRHFFGVVDVSRNDADMLRQAWGDGAGAYESAAAWGRQALPLLQRLGPADNGQALTV